MKLIVAIVQDKDGNNLMNRLVKEGIGVTKLASSGGFLKRGNTTFMMGVDENDIDKVLESVKETCKKREEIVPQTPMLTESASIPVPITVGGATVFILDVSQFHHF